MTVFGADAISVRRVLSGDAFIVESANLVVVFAADDVGDVESPTAQQVSRQLGCVTAAWSVHDDDVFVVVIYDDGDVVLSGAVDDVGMVGDEIEPPDAGGVVSLLGRGDAAALVAALTGDFVSATERHAAVLDALELPTFAAGWGFEQLERDLDGFDGPAISRVDGRTATATTPPNHTTADNRGPTARPDASGQRELMPRTVLEFDDFPGWEFTIVEVPSGAHVAIACRCS